MNTTVFYAREARIEVTEFISCLERSTLAERRPVDNLAIMQSMIENADLIITARNEGGQLIGISRAITDFAYCTYLSDLAVDVAHQGQGIGKRLIQLTHEHAGLQTMLILLSAPKAVTYYPHIGMTQHQSAWYLPRVETSAKG